MLEDVTLQWEYIWSNFPAIEIPTDTGRRSFRQDQVQSVGTLLCEADRLL